MAVEEETIADTLKTLLTTSASLSDIKTVNFDKVQVAIDDFRDYELPAVQLWDLKQINKHVRGYQEVSWNVALEIIMRQTTAGEVDQKALWDLRRRIELVLWDKPKLGLSFMIHLRYLNNGTDLHLLDPNYLSRMEFEVLFRRQLTGSC